MAHYGRQRRGVLSAQALAEFAVVAMRKLKPPLDPQPVRRQVERLRHRFPTRPVTDGVVDEALRGVDTLQLPYWDAQMWAVARLHAIPHIISEDDRPGSLDGVRWVNPFAAGFDVATLP